MYLILIILPISVAGVCIVLVVLVHGISESRFKKDLDEKKKKVDRQNPATKER